MGTKCCRSLGTVPTTAHAAEKQGAIKKTQGFAWRDKGCPFSRQDFPQNMWPSRGQRGTNVPGATGHTKPGSHMPSQSSLALGSLTIPCCLGL